MMIILTSPRILPQPLFRSTFPVRSKCANPPQKFGPSGPPNGLLFTVKRAMFPTIFIRAEKRFIPLVCHCKLEDKRGLDSAAQEGKEVKLSVLERWDVPWQGQTIVLTMLASALSFVLTGYVAASLLSYLGFEGGDLSLDGKAELLLLNQLVVTAVILGVIFSITNSFQPLPDDIFRYDWKEPFNLRDGWLLWAGVGLLSAIVAIALTGSVLTFVNGETPQRETDALMRLLPLIGSSTISTASLLGITGILAPLLEETIFRGFFMVSLTKWLPTPVAVLLSAAVFALAHLTPGEFPQLFVLGAALGFSYAHTRNLLTPITIHALWNSGVIILLTFLQLQGYDIRQLLQGS